MKRGGSGLLSAGVGDDRTLALSAPTTTVCGSAVHAGSTPSAVCVRDDSEPSEDVDDEEEENEADGEEDELIEDPSEDIRGDLARILQNDLDFKGTFSFHRAYPAAPNPALNIDGLGPVGLPLSVRDATAIKGYGLEASLERTDQIAVDESLRGTWEIDGAKVHYDNPAWVEFMDQTVRDVCGALGVKWEASQPRWELHKLCLDEAGSYVPPRVDTEKANGMFATVVVILPSKFTGSAVRVAHAEMSEIYDASTSGVTVATILAWYTDVKYEVQQITSGVQLALYFNLIHTTHSLRPALSSQSRVLSRLRYVLLSWKQSEDDDNVPHKLLYVLNHKYPQNMPLRGSVLKGLDAHLIALLKNIGPPPSHGFGIGLARFAYAESGPGYDRNRYNKSKYCREYADSDISMEEVEETNVYIDQLVDLEGRLIRDSDLDCELESEMIPVGLVKKLTSGAHDDQIYDAYDGSILVTRYYRRTVVVIWPKWANSDIMRGAGGFTYACEKLRASTTRKPTDEELELVQIIIGQASASRDVAAVPSLCHVAMNWNDYSLWSRAVESCDASRSITSLGGEDFVYQAIATWGFEQVKVFLENALDQDVSNVGPLQFLKNYQIWAADQVSATQRLTPPAGWIKLWREKRFNALKKADKEEHKPLTALAMEFGGVEFFENKVLPHIVSGASGSELVEYAVYLYGERAVPEERRSRLARSLLLTSITQLDVYAKVPKEQAAYSHYGQSGEESRQLERLKPYVSASLVLGCTELFAQIVVKLEDGASVRKDALFRRVKNLLLPLIVFASPCALGAAMTEIQKLCRVSVTHWIRLVKDDTQLLAESVASVLEALVSGGLSNMVLTEVIPQLEEMQLNNSHLCTLVDELNKRRRALDPTGDYIQAAIVRLLGKWADTHTTLCDTPSRKHPYPVIDAFEYCHSVGAPEACSAVVSRLLNPPTVDATYVKRKLAPLIPELCGYIEEYINATTITALIPPLLRSIMLYWTEKVMGTRPLKIPSSHLQALKKWVCACLECNGVRIFLGSDREESKSWHRIGAPKRRHVEEHLQTYAESLATWETIRSTPQGLTVKKSDVVLAPGRWVQHRKEGLRLLNIISTDTAKLQAILGPDYDRIVGLLRGRSPLSDASAPVASGSNCATASGSQVPSATFTSVASGSSLLRPPPAAQTHVAPLAKRRKTAYDPKDVIDLT